MPEIQEENTFVNVFARFKDGCNKICGCYISTYLEARQYIINGDININISEIQLIKPKAFIPAY